VALVGRRPRDALPQLRRDLVQLADVAAEESRVGQHDGGAVDQVVQDALERHGGPFDGDAAALRLLEAPVHAGLVLRRA
jgi:hypothetical protein